MNYSHFLIYIKFVYLIIIRMAIHHLYIHIYLYTYIYIYKYSHYMYAFSYTHENDATSLRYNSFKFFKIIQFLDVFHTYVSYFYSYFDRILYIYAYIYTATTCTPSPIHIKMMYIYIYMYICYKPQTLFL
jgi:hypothetical protein